MGGGGKETPRAKMVGMMYLVLTALLALNVSKSILDAFVAIEENIQIANENEYLRGQEKLDAIEENATSGESPELKAKAKKLVDIVKQIDKMVGDNIKLIDDVKLEILTVCQEKLEPAGTPESIVVRKYNPAEPIRPTRFNLMHVEGKDKYDEPMHILVGDEITKPKATGTGMKMWNSYMKLRKDLSELIASSQTPNTESGKKYFFKAPEIYEYKDNVDLLAQIDKAIKASNIHLDDVETVKKIYASMTKLERSEVHEVKNVHWLGKTFDHSPNVAAIASLSALQKEILTARADAIALLRSRIGGGEYSFDKIMPLAYGPSLANSGDDVEVEVLMAAYDSSKQPEVTSSSGSVQPAADGKAVIKLKVSGGAEMKLSGTVTIRNKAGVAKTRPWEKIIKIMKPQGTVSLPDLRVLYRGYDNKVEAVASGYDQTNITGSNVTLSKSGTGWIGKPGAGKTATITVSGKSSVSNKSVNLGTFEFRVSNLPDPELYWGGAKNGEKGSKVEKKLFAKYPPEIPLNATFKVVDWECQVPGAQGAPPKGNGSDISSASGLISAVKPGMNVSFICNVVGPDGVRRKKAGAWKL